MSITVKNFFDIEYTNYLKSEMFRYNDFNEYLIDNHLNDRHIFRTLQNEANERYSKHEWPYNNDLMDPKNLI
jgi:hypothetical protein